MTALTNEIKTNYKNQITNGRTFEKTIAAYLKDRYPNSSVQEQRKVGKKIGSYKDYKVDIFFDNKVLISAKYQKTAGTSEEKIAYEILTLQRLCEREGYKKAFLVHYGDGFTMLDEYKSDEMSQICNASNVEILSFDEFMEAEVND